MILARLAIKAFAEKSEINSVKSRLTPCFYRYEVFIAMYEFQQRLAIVNGRNLQNETASIP